MPIKLPKTFARRKSSGNVLDEVQAGNNRDSSSSFRVLARPNSSGRSLDAGNTLKHLEVAPQPPQKTSFELDNEDLFSVARNDAANRYVEWDTFRRDANKMIVEVAGHPIHYRQHLMIPAHLLHDSALHQRIHLLSIQDPERM